MTFQNLIGMANISLKQEKIIFILGIPSVDHCIEWDADSANC